jgi:hypothetical protein
MAGAASPQLQTEKELIKVIREAGREVVQRNTFYEPVKVWSDAGAIEETPSPETSRILEDNLATG